MQRDLKIGLFAGLIIAGATMLYISTRPSLSPRARILKSNQHQEPQVEPEFKPEPVREKVQIAPLPDLRKPVEPVRYIEPIPEPEVEQPQPVIIQKPQPEPETPTYVSTEKIKTTRFYIVRQGDTLSKISKRYYGSASQWPRIYQANRNVIGNDPDKLKLGTKLIIPD